MASATVHTLPAPPPGLINQEEVRPAAELEGAVIPKPAASAQVVDATESAPRWTGFRGDAAAETMPSPSDIRGLVEYRRKRRDAARQGRSIPKLDLGTLVGNPPAPAVVDKLLRGVDALMPRIIQEKGLTLTQLFRLDDTMERGESSPWQKTIVGASAVIAGYIAFQIAEQVQGVGDVAIVAGSLIAGNKLAGAIAYLMHDLIDEYDWFAESFEFQVHHEDPAELGKWDAAKTVANIGRLMGPALGILAALEPSLGVTSASLALLGTLHLSPLFHKWAHLPPLPKDASRFQRFQRKLIDLAQKAGVIVSREAHAEHHGGRKVGRMEREPRLPHTETFDVATGHALGDVNTVLNDLEVSQRLKRAIYLVSKWMTGTGVEPHSWTEHPELRLRWGGEGSDAERLAAYRAYRIEKAEGRIDKAKAELAAAQALLAGAGGTPPDPQASRRAELAVQGLPGTIAKMEAELAQFRAGQPRPRADPADSSRAYSAGKPRGTPDQR